MEMAMVQEILKDIKEKSGDRYEVEAAELFFEENEHFLLTIPVAGAQGLEETVRANVKMYADNARNIEENTVSFAEGMMNQGDEFIQFLRTNKETFDVERVVDLGIGSGADPKRLNELMKSYDVIAFFLELTRTKDD